MSNIIKTLFCSALLFVTSNSLAKSQITISPLNESANSMTILPYLNNHANNTRDSIDIEKGKDIKLGLIDSSTFSDDNLKYLKTSQMDAILVSGFDRAETQQVVASITGVTAEGEYLLIFNPKDRSSTHIASFRSNNGITEENEKANVIINHLLDVVSK